MIKICQLPTIFFCSDKRSDSLDKAFLSTIKRYFDKN